ncbi:hypothetical protein ACHAPA_004146 [Fusarium lateritium]
MSWPISRSKSRPQLPHPTPNKSMSFGDFVRSRQQIPARTLAKGLQEPKSTQSTDVEKLSSLLSKAETPAQAIDIFDKELDKIDPKDHHAFLCGIISKTPSSTELFQQAVRRNTLLNISEGRRKTDIAWLDKQWGGPDWLPQDIRLACSQPGAPFEPSAELLTQMKKITNVAHVNGVSLNVLWADDGDLRYAATSHFAGAGRKAIVSGYGRPASGESREISKMVADCIGLLPSTHPVLDSYRQPSGVAEHGESTCTNDVDKTALVPSAGGINRKAIEPISRRSTVSKMRKRNMGNLADQEPTDSRKQAANHKEQIYNAANSDDHRYKSYKSLVTALTPEEVERLRAQAVRYLEEAEAEKAAADFALGEQKGREDQIRETRQHSDTCTQNETSSPVSQDRPVHAHEMRDKPSIDDNFSQFDGTIFRTYSCNCDHCISDKLHTQHEEAAKKLKDAKKGLRILDHIEKAKFMQESCNEMREYQRKLRILVDETEKRLQTMEAAFIDSFRDAEEENWASLLESEK